MIFFKSLKFRFDNVLKNNVTQRREINMKIVSYKS